MHNILSKGNTHMSNTVKELAKQAGQGETYHIPPEFIACFAELIVEECTSRINDLKGYTGVNNLREIVSTIDWNFALTSSIHEVKSILE